jgi:hypothetical protein
MQYFGTYYFPVSYWAGADAYFGKLAIVVAIQNAIFRFTSVMHKSFSFDSVMTKSVSVGSKMSKSLSFTSRMEP